MALVEFPRVVWEFIAATNAQDLEWLESLFTERCAIAACGYRAAGLRAVAEWVQTEVLAPSIFLSIEDVRCTDEVTTIHVRADDRGLMHDCTLAFRTRGRYIESLMITRLKEPARQSTTVTDVKLFGTPGGLRTPGQLIR
jgi:hypothetical protein